LRSEYASRLVEKGVPLSPVRDLLGHCSIVMTERYDRQVLATLKEQPGSWTMVSLSRFFQGRTISPPL
jgi:integrase